MTVEEIKNKLDRAFGKYEFVEDGHYYLCNGKRVGIGVTTFIGQFENEFEKELIAQKVADKENRPVEEILAEWQYKADFACSKGTTCHEFNQILWNGEEWKLIPFDNSKEYLQAVDKIKGQAINFKNDYQDMLEHIKDEYIVGSEEYDIASAIDHLFYNKLTGGIVLVDYKTNTVLKGYNDDKKNARYTKQMKIPLQDIKDDALHHYYIQLSIYKFIIEKYTNLKIDEMFIVYMSENNDDYEIIDIEYLEDEVKKILEMRRVKGFMNNNMSVPVLVIGKSGSGKSTSLRNFNKDDIAVINILGKPLPFKSEIKAVKCNDYATIIQAIKGTKKKTIVIDDCNYLMTQEFMAKAKQTGYTKFTEIALNFYNLIEECKNVGGGKTIYFFMHEETSNDGSIVKPKTIGQMLDSQVCIEGIFTICLRAMCSNGNYIFSTKTNGQDCVKTPFDMYEVSEVPNDLKEVDKVIREYYELDKEDKKEEK